MKRIQPISKAPSPATDTPTDVWLTLVRDFLNVLIPFFTGKDPNPVSLIPDEEPDTTT
jgi:hypothetical protein